MKCIRFFLLSTIILIPVRISAEQFQTGIAVGSVTGFTGKIWVSEKRGLYASWDPFINRIFQASHLWKWDHLPKQLKDYEEYIDSVYIGVGGTVKMNSSNYIGIIIPIGVIKNFYLFNWPLSASFEIAPIRRLSPSFGFNLQSSISLTFTGRR